MIVAWALFLESYREFGHPDLFQPPQLVKKLLLTARKVSRELNLLLGFALRFT